jgi:transposase
LSKRAAARRFGIDPRTVAKMVAFSVPPGYRRTKPPVRPKLDAFIAIIDGILAEDQSRPKKQRHTAKRIFERLRDEHGFAGGITIVKDYVAGWRQRAQEMFVPLVHPPGHAQADFGEALGIIGGVERKIHFFAFCQRGVIFHRRAGAKIHHGIEQEGPRYRGPSCFRPQS